MLRHEVDDRWSTRVEHWAVHDNETVHLRAGHICERLLELARLLYFEGLKLDLQSARRGLRVLEYVSKLGFSEHSGLPEECHAGDARDRLFQQPQSHRGQFGVVLH